MNNHEAMRAIQELTLERNRLRAEMRTAAYCATSLMAELQAGAEPSEVALRFESIQGDLARFRKAQEADDLAAKRIISLRSQVAPT